MPKVDVTVSVKDKEIVGRKAIEFPVMAKLDSYVGWALVWESPDDIEYLYAVHPTGEIEVISTRDINLAEIELAPVGTVFTFTQSS